MRPWLIVLVACHRDPAPATITNRTAAAVPADAPPPPTTCERYDKLVDQALACTVLAKDVRDRIDQARTDTQASIAESGLDGGERVDPDEACERQLDELRRLAGPACNLR